MIIIMIMIIIIMVISQESSGGYTCRLYRMLVIQCNSLTHIVVCIEAMYTPSTKIEPVGCLYVFVHMLAHTQICMQTHARACAQTHTHIHM